MQNTAKKTIGVVVLLLPVLLAAPWHYWVMNYAGSWYVSTRLEPHHRSVHLAQMYFLDMSMMVCLTCFPGLLLLYYGSRKHRVIGWSLIPAALLLVPGMFWLFVLVWCYFKFST